MLLRGGTIYWWRNRSIQGKPETCHKLDHIMLYRQLSSVKCIGINKDNGELSLSRTSRIFDYICKTQINVQSLIDVQSSNRRPIRKPVAIFHFLKLTFIVGKFWKQ